MKLIADRVAARRKAGSDASPAGDHEASEGMLFSSGLIAGGALMGVGVAVLILLSGRWAPLANALEAIRSDGVKLEYPGDVRAVISVGGRPVADRVILPVRSRWIEANVAQPDGSTVVKRELEPRIGLADGWRPFEGLTITASSGDDQDTLTLDYDAEARARVVRFVPVDTWDAPLVVESLGPGVGQGTLARWLVKEGDAIGYGQPVAEVMTPLGTEQVRAPQSGRLASRAIAEGAPVPVQASLGVLERSEPPISAGKPPPPTPRRRLVVEARPGSDAAAMLWFLALCALLVISAQPRRKPATGASPPA